MKTRSRSSDQRGPWTFAAGAPTHACVVPACLYRADLTSLFCKAHTMMLSLRHRRAMEEATVPGQWKGAWASRAQRLAFTIAARDALNSITGDADAPAVEKYGRDPAGWPREFFEPFRASPKRQE